MNLRIGDPFDPATQLGPVISARQRDRVLSYAQYGLEDGARLVTGGVAAKVPGHEGGFFVEPTVFADVKSDMRIFQEEVFGREREDVLELLVRGTRAVEGVAPPTVRQRQPGRDQILGPAPDSQTREGHLRRR